VCNTMQCVALSCSLSRELQCVAVYRRKEVGDLTWHSRCVLGVCLSVRMCICVCERARGESKSERERMCVCVRVRVCVCIFVMST